MERSSLCEVQVALREEPSCFCQRDWSPKRGNCVFFPACDETSLKRVTHSKGGQTGRFTRSC